MSEAIVADCLESCDRMSGQPLPSLHVALWNKATREKLENPVLQNEIFNLSVTISISSIACDPVNDWSFPPLEVQSKLLRQKLKIVSDQPLTKQKQIVPDISVEVIGVRVDVAGIAVAVDGRPNVVERVG